MVELKKKGIVKQVIAKRQIVIETDGSSINIIKNETVGVIELRAILVNLVGYIDSQQKNN